MGDCIEALRAYRQYDEDGVMCIVSRQAVDEAADELERLRAEVARYKVLYIDCHNALDEHKRAEVAEAKRRASSAEFELNCLEQVRLRDNQYLIDRAEKAERELAALRERIEKAPVRDTYVEGEHGR